MQRAAIGERRSIVFGGVLAGALGLLGWVATACEPDNGSGGGGNTSGAPNFCSPELVEAGLGILCDGGLDGFAFPGPGSSGGSGEIIQAMLKIVSITGSCTGTVQSDQNCTVTPAEVKTTIAFADSENRSTGVVTDRVIAPPSYCGSITGACRVTQPAATGTKLCPPAITPAPCTDFKGEDEYTPFSVIADLEGGSGLSAMIRFKVAIQHEPTTCRDQPFENIEQTEAPYVPLSPAYSISALKSGPVTLVGSATVQVNSGGLIGSLVCEYTVGIRPTNSAGE